MLDCINKNSFRLLLISFQIVKANDSCLPLPRSNAFSTKNKRHFFIIFSVSALLTLLTRSLHQKLISMHFTAIQILFMVTSLVTRFPEEFPTGCCNSVKNLYLLNPKNVVPQWWCWMSQIFDWLPSYHSCPVQQPVTRKLFLIVTKKLVGAFVVEQVL